MRNKQTAASSSNEADLQDLTQALEQLRLAQERIDSVRQRIEDRAQRTSVTTSTAGSNTTYRTRQRLVHSLARYAVGDHVHVKNPKGDQHDSGIVFGATRSALVRVRTPNGEEVNRLSKILILLEAADEREQSEHARARSATARGQMQ